MIATWSWLSLIILLVPVTTMYLLSDPAGEQVNQKAYVVNDLVICVKTTESSLVTKYKHQFACINRHLFRCMLRNTPLKMTRFSEPEFTSPDNIYCGAFTMNQRLTISFKIKLFIEVVHTHMIHWSVFKFNFKRSRHISCVEHGFIVLYDVKSNVTFCGNRVPWKMVIPSHQASLQLSITGHIDHSLSLFFNSFKKKSTSSFIPVNQLYLQYQKPISTAIAKKSGSIQIYIMTSHMTCIYVYAKSSGPVRGFLGIHDGPGPLSKNLIKLSNTNISRNILAKTSAYWAFLNFHTDYNLAYNINLFFKQSFKKVRSCYRNNMFIERSSKIENKICLQQHHIRGRQVTLYIKRFEFSGPSMVADTSSNICEYGGIHITLSEGEILDFCEDIYNLHIYPEIMALHMILVWFSGYSNGWFLGDLESSRCGTLYLERHPAHTLYQPDIVYKMNTSAGCRNIVCPPLVNTMQTSCTLQLGPPSLGPTIIKIFIGETLEPCDSRLVKTDKGTPFTYNYKLITVSTEHWPFGLNNNTQTRKSSHMLSSRNIHKFDFLQRGNITSTIGCNAYSTRKQIAVLIGMSACKKRRTGMAIKVVNNIPSLTQQCLNLRQKFVAVDKHLPNARNYHDFIYVAPDGPVTGHLVSVNYESCPAVCRNYEYSVIVRATDKKTIVKHTAHVGYSTLTGYYHIGFRVSIILPDVACPQTEQCFLYIQINNPTQPIGEYKQFVSGSAYYLFRKNIFYTQRYVQFIIHMRIICLCTPSCSRNSQSTKSVKITHFCLML